MPNFESNKRPHGQVKTTQKRKRQPEYTKMRAAGVELMNSGENTQDEKYRMLIQSIPCAVYSACPGEAGPTTFMSDKWKDWTGYSPEELYRDPQAWPKCIHPDDREEAVNAYSKACQENVPYNLEYRVVHKGTEQVRYVRDQGLLSKDKKGDIIRVDGIITDISELKLAEKSQQESEEKFRNFLNNMGDIAYETDTSGNVTYSNKMGEKITGVPLQDIIGKPFLPLFTKESQEKAIDVYERTLSGESTEYELTFTNGRICHFKNEPLRDENGKITGVFGIARDITERKKVGKALRVSEERFRMMLENLPNVAVQGYAPDGTIHYWNKANESIYGYTAEEAIGKDLVELIIPPEMRDSVREAIAHGACTSEMPPAAELNLTRKDGSRVTVWSSHAVVRHAGKEPELFCIDVDLSELKRAEKALRESEERFKNLFNNALLGLYRTTPDGRILMANPALVRMLGYNCFEELARRNLEEEGFEPRYIRSDFKKRVEVNGRVIGLEADWVRSDGTILSIRESAKAIRDEHGNILYYEGTVEDITERKQAEEQLVIFRKFAEASEQALAMADLEGYVTYANPTLCRILGVQKAQDLYGTSLTKYYLEKDLPTLQEEVLPAVIESGHQEVEMPLLSVDDKITPSIQSIFLIRDERGEPLLLANVMTDITDRKRTEEELKRHRDHLEELVRKRTAELTNAYETLKVENQERKRTEQALREVEREKSTVLENLSDLIVYRDRDMVTLWASKSMANWHGMTQDQIVGRICYKARYGRDEPCEECHVIEAIKSGKRLELEKQLPDERCWHVIVNPVLDDSGQIIGTIEVSQDITERMQSEEALKASEGKLNAMLQSISDHMSMMDKDLNILWVNDVAKRRFGDDIVGKKCYEVYHGRQSPCEPDSCLTLRAFQDGGIHEHDTEDTDKDGNTAWFHCVANVALRNEEGEATAVLEISTDITKRKRAEETLQESKERFRSLSESSPMGVFHTDKEGRVLYTNKRWQEMTGLALEESLGFGWSNALHPDDKKTLLEEWNRCLSEQKGYSGEFRLVSKSGEVKWVYTKTAPIRSETGQVIGHVGSNEDITERKQAEDALRQYEFMVESAHDAIFFKDRQSRYIIANKKTLESFGLSREQVIGKSDYEIMPDREQARQNIDDDQAVFETGKPKEIIKEMTGADGEKRWFQAIKVPQFDKNGDIIGLIGIARDITERKQAEEELRIREQKLRALLNAPTESAILADTEGTILDINRIAAKRLGKSAEELIGMGIYEYLPADIAEYRMNQGYEVVRSGKPVRFQDEREGRYYDTNIYPVFDDEGEVSSLAVFSGDITERKQAEKALKESESRFRELVENMREVFWMENADGTELLYVSPMYEQIWGRSCQSFYENPKDWIESVHPEDRQRVTEAFSQLRKTGEYSEEFRIVRPDGTIRWIWDRGVLIRNESDEVIHVAGVAEDVTESRQAEKALRESEEKFRSLAEQSPNMIFINKKGRIVYVNRKCEEVMGYTREELCSPDFDFRTLIAPETLGLINDKFAKHLRGQEVRPYDYCLINKKGERIEAINASKLVQYEGQTAILGVVTDITEHKKAERALRESEERLKILFESAPDAIYLIDSEGKIVDGNRASLKLIGFAKDEVIGKSLGEMGLLSGEQLSRAESNLKKVATGKLSGPNEYVLKRGDGTYVSIEVRTFPVKIEGKMMTLGIARDTTEQKRTEKELLEHHAKLKSLASQLSLTEERERHRLATDLHDQISQSLVISKIKLDQLRKSSVSDEFDRPLNDISNCLGQIIDDTRALTFDLSYPILYELGFEAAVAEWLTDQIQEKHRIKIEFEDDKHPKPLDDNIRVLLFRNVRELLINVIKHAKANKVRVSIRRDNEYINVRVEDDGVGFDPVEVTSMAAKRAEFGLFSIRERLEQLGGMIEIDSKPNCGSKITMRAPLKYNNSTDRIGK